MRVIIAGSRSASNYADVVEAMATASLFDIVPSTIFSGGAKGADTLGEQWAKANHVPVNRFIPIWRNADGVFNPRAGFTRNEDMCRHADALVALWDGDSPGTRHCIDYATKRNLLVWVHRIPRPVGSLRGLRSRNPYED